MTTPFDEYLESKVMTATPHQLHLMVVDAAIRNAVAAEQAFQQRRFDNAHVSLSQAGQMVMEMISRLDSSRMPDLVENLKGLFLFIHSNLIQADRERNPTRVADALQVLRLHRDTWLELAEQLKREALEVSSTPSSGFSWST